MSSRNHVRRRRKQRENPRQKNTSNTCTSPSCCCEAPRRLTQAVAAGKPERMQIYPPIAEFARKILRRQNVRNQTPAAVLISVVCTSKKMHCERSTKSAGTL